MPSSASIHKHCTVVTLHEWTSLKAISLPKQTNLMSNIGAPKTGHTGPQYLAIFTSLTTEQSDQKSWDEINRT